MTAPKPPPRTLQPAEERKIQLFLERAAPIVLENPQLTTERWQVLIALANELDLTADQLRSTLDDLLNRGVLKGLEFTPPKPPPLPGHLGKSTVSSPSEVSPAEDFALSPPGSPPVQVSPEPQQKPPPTPSAPKPPPIMHGGKSVPEESVNAPPPVVATQPNKTPREQFLEQVKAIIAEQRGVNSKSQAMFASVAQKLGLSDAEAREALHSLQSPEEPPAAANESVPPSSERQLLPTRWRIEGAPAPVAPPPPKSPTQTFLEFARPSLASVRDGVVSEDLEQRLIAHGTRVLGLSAVYARHLLLDLVAERKLRFASAAESPPPASRSATIELEPRLVEFLQAAKPILAQYRGLNSQSRARLNAMAREQGLTDADVDRAISTLMTREPDEPVDRTQQERLIPFRVHVEAGLKKATRGILTPALNDKFVTAGVDLFGLQSDAATAAVLDVTEKLKLAVITVEQAERHVADLLNDMSPAGVELTRGQHDRIELEGAQWGLQATRVKTLIEEHLRQKALQARAEERMSRWALSAAGVAVVLVVGFFIYTAIARNQRRSAPNSTTIPAPAPASTPETKPDPSWVDANTNLAISVVNARTDFPTMRKAFMDLTANDVARRNTAYDSLVEYFFQQVADEVRRKQLSELLSLCVAKDPVDESAGRLVSALLKDVSSASDKSPSDANAFPQMFWGVRVVAIALHHAEGQAPRIAQIVAALHRVIGITPDASLPVAELEQVCLQSLAERLFRSLIAAAGGSEPNAAPLHAALVKEATHYLDAARLDKFNAEFLTARLTAEPAQWRNYEDLLRFTVGSRDPLAVLRLVELYESTENSELREMLSQLLLSRIPEQPPGRTVEEIAAFVKQSLGVKDVYDPDGVFAKLSRDVRGVLAKPAPAAEPTAPCFADLLQLAHFSTLACAFAQNEWSNATIVEIRKAGPPQPDAGMETKSDAPGESPSSPASLVIDRTTADALRTSVAALTARRAQPSDRLVGLDSLVLLTKDIPDLPPEAAAIIATYLVNNKSSTEHARVLQNLSELSKWNQLLVALADRLEDGSLTNEQLAGLMNTLRGSERKLPEGKEARAEARRELWQLIMLRLATTQPAGKTNADVPENTARLLANAYATQARLMNIPIPEAVAKSGDPLATLRVLVDELASRFSAGKLSDRERADLNRIPHELTALDFVSGGNDVQRLAALERIWLKLLALETARRNETRAGEARELVANLQQKDRQAKHVLSQLRDGQATELQMWMLIGKRG